MTGASGPIPSGRTVLYGLGAAVLAFLLYAPTISHQFAYDDATVVLRHPLVLAEEWSRIATSAYHVGSDVRVPTGIYRPLTIASLAANHAISGLKPWSYHLGNVLLHAVATWLVFLLAVELALPPAWSLAAAALFAVHPVHVEAVANVAGRGELLAAVFALAGLLAYFRNRPVVMGLLLLASCFAKENAVTIVGVVVLWEILRRRPANETGSRGRVRASAIRLAAALAPILVYLVARFAVIGSFGLRPDSVTPIENPVVGLGSADRAATVLSVFVRALSLTLTPVRLSPDYGYAEIVPATLFSPGAIVGALLLAGLVALIVLARKTSPRVAFLVGSAIVTYSIVSNAFVIIGTILGDRLLYLPSAFACIVLAIGIAAIAGSAGRGAAIGLAVTVTLAFAARSISYAAVWRDDTSLFTYAARVCPRSVRAIGGYAEILGEQGHPESARPILDRAVAIAPDFIPNRLNRAAAELSLGDLAAARADAQHVLTLDPRDPVAARILEAISQHDR